MVSSGVNKLQSSLAYQSRNPLHTEGDIDLTGSTSTLPHWDMTVVYPSIGSEEFERDFADTIREIGDLVALFDRHNVRAAANSEVSDETIRAFDEVISSYNNLVERVHTLFAYIHSFVDTNSRDSEAQARLSELQQHMVPLSQLSTRFTAWVGSLNVDALIAESEQARAHGFALREAKIEAQHLMSPAEEALAAELNLSGGTAWSKLHSNLTSQITVEMKLDGKVQHLPMSAVRNLAYDPDRDVRERAYNAELAAWEVNALPLASALNGIKGQVNVLSRHRGWDSPLDAALFGNRMDRQSLDAMLQAARGAFPDFRRYLNAKAKLLGIPKLAFFDLFAPVGESRRVWEYDESVAFIMEQFGTFSPRLSGLASRAFGENWIDAEPRSGKVDGAYCMSLRGDESRVLSNYKPVFGGASTLAHELGHAYHNFNLKGRTPIQRDTPMTLAETASTFCETIVFKAALQGADEKEKLAILEESIQGACQIVVDITSRFQFESRVFEERLKHELSIDEFNDIMLAAQKDTYGDGLDPEKLHPYMWAVKSHYYSAGRSFYNYPYMFGLLFGLGLYARYQQSPSEFTSSYDELLSSTGLDDAAALASRFGIDIRSTKFWNSSLDIVRADIDEYEKLANALTE